MADKTDKKKSAGRPRAVIDQAQFEACCGCWCTEAEMMSILGVTDKTLNRWCRETYGVTFREAYKMHSDRGKMSLRRAQLQAALEDRNPTLLIWLGKQKLGQYDPDKIKKEEAGQDDGVQIINDIGGADDDEGADA